MKKKVFSVLVIAFVLTLCLCGCTKKVDPANYTADDMKNVLNQVYDKVGRDKLPEIQTSEVMADNVSSVFIYTGLTDVEGLSAMVETEPVLASEGFSVVMLKMDSKERAEAVRQSIYDTYTASYYKERGATTMRVTSYDNIVVIMISSQDNVENLYKGFKSVCKTKDYLEKTI